MSVPKTRGFITHAVGNLAHDYVRLAYALALSLRASQPRGRGLLSVVVDDPAAVPTRYRAAFDQVIKLPGDDSGGATWRVHNYSRLYDLSPYDQTITVDADTIILTDQSEVWESLQGLAIAPGRAMNYRGEAIEFNPLRKPFYAVGMPDVHNGYLYFERSDVTARLFDTMRWATVDWESARRQYFPGLDLPYSSDASMLIALRDTGVEDLVRSTFDLLPRFVHMKACLQGWAGVGEYEREWRPYAHCTISADLDIDIEGHAIRLPFHYYVKDFIDAGILENLEASASCS